MKSRRSGSLMHEGAQLKLSVSRTRSRAQFVGFVYLFAMIVLTLVACFPLFDLTKQTDAYVGVFAFWRVFTAEHLKAATRWSGMLKIVNATFYAVMLLVLVINLLRAFCKLDWLYKKTVSKTYGLNRNVYAMEDLGKIFSGSFALVLTTYFLIALLCGEAHYNVLMIVFVVFGVLVHLFAGFIGGKASYFNVENNKVVEDARTISRFPALLRNLMQLAVVFAAMYYLQKISTMHTVVGPILEKNGYQNYFMGCEKACLSVFFQGVAAACLIPLIFHATAITEYNIDGVYGSGMKTFRVFILFFFLAMGASVACQNYFGLVMPAIVDGAPVIEIVKTLNMDAVVLAGVALVMFFIELLMRNMPGQKGEKKRKDKDETAADSSVVLYIYNN